LLLVGGGGQWKSQEEMLDLWEGQREAVGVVVLWGERQGERIETLVGRWAGMQMELWVLE
jgi:hypothetical protein